MKTMITDELGSPLPYSVCSPNPPPGSQNMTVFGDWAFKAVTELE